MSHYRRNADANRDALFGSAPADPSGSRKPRAKKKPVVSVSSSTNPSTSTTRATASSFSEDDISSIPTSNNNNNNNNNNLSKSSPITSTSTSTLTLSGEAKAIKMKEAEKYRDKAKKSLQKSLFTRPDPIAAAMFYRKAAEAYKVCDENRLERLHRIAGGDCQMGHGAYATAASEYMRAAELSLASDESLERKKQECLKLYDDAANAWREAGENGRAGECLFKSAFSSLYGKEQEQEQKHEMIDGVPIDGMDKDVLTSVEKAIETFVPDPLNRYGHFRKTGISDYIDPDTEDGSNSNKNTQQDEEALLQLCKENMVTSSYAHETLFDAVYKLSQYGEYSSALYASGAASAILESESFSTISLSRSYCIETILTLAVGDVIKADETFVQVHLQKSSYLTARECKLAEDLIRAIKMMNQQELEETRSPMGSNRVALSNLHNSLRKVVMGLRITGVAKKAAPVTATGMPAPTVDDLSQSAIGRGLDAEMDDLMNDMGLNSDGDDDDELDLR